jgi:PPOX class probable FMN-dependent enzyme
MTEISSPEQLRELLGAVGERATNKERTAPHPRDRDFIAACPFVVIATADDRGNCDASPKGDPAGFVKVLDDRTLAIPERPGNRGADGYFNILANPHVGLLFVIPGRDETPRINGRARIVDDAPYFDEMLVRGHRPALALEVAVEQVFFHCGKAFPRSALWRPDSWTPGAIPAHACLVKEIQPVTETLAELTAHYSAENYETLLYRH